MLRYVVHTILHSQLRTPFCLRHSFLSCLHLGLWVSQSTLVSKRKDRKSIVQGLHVPLLWSKSCYKCGHTVRLQNWEPWWKIESVNMWGNRNGVAVTQGNIWYNAWNRSTLYVKSSSTPKWISTILWKEFSAFDCRIISSHWDIENWMQKYEKYFLIFKPVHKMQILSNIKSNRNIYATY